MTIIFGRSQAVLFDCSSLLNLYASRYLGEVIAALPLPCAVASTVVDEACYVVRGGDGQDAGEREGVDLAPLIDAGLLVTWELATAEEYAGFVDLAAEIDDGEAATCALALRRAGAVVTDDRKTHQVMRRVAPGITVLTTSQIVKHWTESCDLASGVLRTGLLDIQTRARFVPGKHDPLVDWWEKVLT